MRAWLSRHKFPLLAFLVWRCGLYFMALYLEKVGAPLNPTFPYLNDLSGVSRSTSTFAFFDGLHYLRIASYGYKDVGTQAFFPLYPALIRAGSFITGSLLSSGLVISSLSTLASLLLIWNTFAKKTAKKIILFILVFPTSFFLASVYTEGLFLLEITLWVRAIRNKDYTQSAIISGLASATRITGIALAAGTVIGYVIQNRGRIRKKLASLLLISTTSVSGLVAYMLFLLYRFKDPFMFHTVQPMFGAGREGEGVILLPQVLYRYARILLTASPSSFPYKISAFELIVFAFSLYLIYLLWKRRKVEETAMTSLAVLLPTLSGSLSSMPRYVLPILSLFIVWESQYKSNLSYYLTLILMLTTQVYFFIMFAEGAFIS